MTNTELSKQFIVEFIKLFVSGVLGGMVVSIINYRLFKAQKRLDAKYELQKKRLDVLRDIDSILHWLYRDIFYNWESPLNKDQAPDEYIVELVNKVHYWETLFLDDEEMSATLQKLNALVGVSKNEFFGKDKPSQKALGVAINEIRMAVRNKIVKIQNS
ncbi:MAG: hypothetical protein HY863_10835 [Chloroflexi bacterium]|nr:hypothetical protein [Chloroflexota bacterium]